MGIHSEADRKIAIRVLKQSRQIRKWVESQLTFFGIDPDSPEAASFRERESTKAAERLIK